MRAVWFAGGIVVMLAVGIGLFTPHSKFTPTRQNINAQPPATNQSTTETDLNQLMLHPFSYTDRTTCTSGYYQSNFELSVLGPTANVTTGTVTDPVVWTTVTIPSNQITCQAGAANVTTCFGHVHICGIFSYKPKAGFGRNGQYKFQISD